ncbi:LysM peptidoglycan-binding domain-containing protein [Ornithinimicrobium murale]|uniref:LysM peptidoglycan-binding domain-containing protein n=1 Tax=Ornithinimicrobium murale TaxID=1050153 RepID=UPI000E0DE658|nr:LysM peptidoglycan-binding domain-containing protein [Ornithinimicrobium murale]
MRFIRGLLALLVLGTLVVGLPAGLLAFGTLDGIPALSDVWDTLTGPDDGSLLLSILTVIGWAGWASFALGVLIEVPAQVRAVPAPKLPGLSVPQAGARVLIAAVIAMFAVAGTPGGADAQTDIAEPGDTMSSLAQEHLGDGRLWPQIAQANPDITDPDIIHPGDELDIPGGDADQVDTNYDTVTVQEGDTLSGLAREHLGDGRLWPQIAQANPDITDPDVIHPGDELAIPGGDVVEQSGTDDEVPTVRLTPIIPTHEEVVETPGPTQPSAASVEATPVEVETVLELAAEEGASSAPPDAATDSADRVDTAVGVGACAAAGVLLLLATRRAAQSRRRRPGRRIAMPSGRAAAIEPRLREDSDSLAVSDLDRALRTIADWSRRNDTPMPAVRGALIAPDAIELYLIDEDAELPTPFEAVDDQGTWALRRRSARYLLTPEETHTVPAPCPTLVTVGHDQEDGWVLLNLEEVGALNVTGSPTACEAVLSAMALELAGTGWADDLRVTLVGVLPELASALGSDRVEHVTSLRDVLPGLDYASRVHGRTLSDARQPSVTTARSSRVAPETWTPHLLVLATDPSEDERTLLRDVLAHTPRLAVAAITTVTDPLSPWVLDLSPGGAVLKPADIDLAPQGVSPGDYADIVEVFEVTEAADVPGPAWTMTLAGESDITELPQADIVTPVSATPATTTDLADTEVPESEVDMGEVRVQAADTVARDDGDVQPIRHPGPIVRLLGPVQIQQAPGKRPQSPGRATELIAFLALHPSQNHKPLDSALWPGQTVDAKRRNPLVTQSRKWLGTAKNGSPHLTYADDGGYRLQWDVLVDWHQLTQVLGDDISEVATGQLVATLRMVDGQPLSGVTAPYYAWAEADRQEMIQTVADLAHEVAARSLSAGDPRTAAWAAAKGSLVAPESELLWRDQLRAAWLSAVPGKVQEVAEQMAAVLEPIGGDMEPETTELLQQLLTDQGPRRAHA